MTFFGGLSVHVRRNSPDPRDANHLEADSALTGEILLFQLITAQLPAASSTARCHQPGRREKGGLAASCPRAGQAPCSQALCLQHVLGSWDSSSSTSSSVFLGLSEPGGILILWHFHCFCNKSPLHTRHRQPRVLHHRRTVP